MALVVEQIRIKGRNCVVNRRKGGIRASLKRQRNKLIRKNKNYDLNPLVNRYRGWAD